MSQFDLEHLNLRMGNDVGQQPFDQIPLVVADSEFGRADLKDQFASLFVGRRECSLTGVLKDARFLGPQIERGNRSIGERAVGHAGDVHEVGHRNRHDAATTAYHAPERRANLIAQAGCLVGECRWQKENGTGGIHIFL